MCIFKCMLNGHCERNLVGLEAELSSDGKVLKYQRSVFWKARRFYAGDAEWRLRDGVYVVTELHNIEMAAFHLLDDNKKSYTSGEIAKYVRTTLGNESIPDSLVISRLSELGKKGLLSKKAVARGRCGNHANAWTLTEQGHSDYIKWSGVRLFAQKAA